MATEFSVMHKLSQYGIISVSQICSCIGKHISYLKSVLHMAYDIWFCIWFCIWHMAYMVLHMAYGIWFPYGFAYGIWHIWFFCIWQVSKKNNMRSLYLALCGFQECFSVVNSTTLSSIKLISLLNGEQLQVVSLLNGEQLHVGLLPPPLQGELLLL